MADKLTPKQRAFADYYIECGNATTAAKRAGYSEKTAYRTGADNLKKPQILKYIEERTRAADKKRVASGDEVLKYLTAVMRGEEKDQFELDASLQDRTRAAELLGKRYGLFRDKVDVEGTIGVTIVDDV